MSWSKIRFLGLSNTLNTLLPVCNNAIPRANYMTLNKASHIPPQRSFASNRAVNNNNNSNNNNNNSSRSNTDDDGKVLMPDGRRVAVEDIEYESNDLPGTAAESVKGYGEAHRSPMMTYTWGLIVAACFALVFAARQMKKNRDEATSANATVVDAVPKAS